MAPTSPRRPRMALLLSLGLLALGAPVLGGAGPAAAAAPAAHGGAPAQLHLLGSKWGDKQADGEALAGGKVNKPEQDPGSLYTVTNAIGARKLWKHTDPQGQPLTGAGVTVAVLDSGVAAVPGLDAAGKVVYGPDLSPSGAGSATSDEYGHGTFMAGLIAAHDDAVKADGKPGEVADSGPQVQQGLAPGARLLALKLADADGATSVQAVVAGLRWVVQHRHDNGMDVRVVNLSFGATALQGYQDDPLAAAVEEAWAAGIVVVASAGNDGPSSAGLADPALDPYVIAVGSSDPLGKRDGWGHATVASYSNRGTAERHPDVVAPGRSVVSLRVPGSAVDAANPQGRVAGDTSGRLFRGSGTSEAAAVTSGVVALLLQAHPELTPDQVKAALTATAEPLKDASALDAGAGQVDVSAALDALDKKDDKLGIRTATQTFAPSTGLDGLALDLGDGSWDGARWNGARWNGARWNGARWNGARWNGARWNGARWNGARWNSAVWDGSDS